MSKIQAAAEAWWINHRPDGWSEYKHLLNPTVNTVDEVEAVLAQYVAEVVKIRHNLRGPYTGTEG